MKSFKEINFYERARQACEEKDTTLSGVLAAIGRSDGSTGNWKAGRSPRLDIVIDIANYLHMSLDEFVYGDDVDSEKCALSESDREWLDLIHCIPAERQEICKAFLKTHMAVPEKYQDKISG